MRSARPKRADWIAFQDVQLGRGATRLEAAVSAAGTAKAEIRLGSPTGPLAGTLTVPATADHYSWTTARPNWTDGWPAVSVTSTSSSPATGTNIRDLTIT